jgi:hypothetical protein
MPRVGFEPAIPATEQPKTYALDRAATGIGSTFITMLQKIASLAHHELFDLRSNTCMVLCHQELT